MKTLTYDDIEKLLDLNRDSTKSLYGSWDKGDCSLIGLIRILLIQEIEKEINERGIWYDGQYDEILNNLYKNYET